MRSLLRRTFLELLLLRSVNRLVFRARFLWFVRVKRQVRTHTDLEAVEGHDYSVDMLLKGRTSDRPLNLVRPLATLVPARDQATVLSIGCRFETELLYLVGHGFAARNIRGLDMISYSPWIDLGNMHSLPYADHSFDAVILGWVLSYSEDPRRAASQAVRVARDGARIAVGVAYYPEHDLEERARQGSTLGVQNRIQTVDGLVDLFDGAVRQVLYQRDAPDPAQEDYCAVVIEVDKPARRRTRGLD